MTTKEHPILFSDEMVRAILDGRKTQTRRPLKTQPETYMGETGLQFELPGWHGSLGAEKFVEHSSPFGVPGDTLWVRECWMPKNWSFAECLKAGCPDAAMHPTEVLYGDATRAIYRASYNAAVGDLRQKRPWLGCQSLGLGYRV